MLTLAVILALVLDRLFPGLRAYRKAYPFSGLMQWAEKHLLADVLPRGLIPFVLVIPILLLVWLLYAVFTADIFTFCLNLLLVFYCLRPGVLNEEVDSWLSEIEAGKASANEQANQLFNLANTSLYVVIFLYLLFGPIAALAYRLLDLLRFKYDISGYSQWIAMVEKILGWLDWLPAIISSYFFMVCGNFDAGMRIARRLPLVESDIQTLNNNRLQKVGIASVGDGHGELTGTDFLRRSRGLLLRSLMLWLLLAAVCEYWL